MQFACGFNYLRSPRVAYVLIRIVVTQNSLCYSPVGIFIKRKKKGVIGRIWQHAGDNRAI